MLNSLPVNSISELAVMKELMEWVKRVTFQSFAMFGRDRGGFRHSDL